MAEQLFFSRFPKHQWTIVYGRLKDEASLYLDKISQEHGLIIGPKILSKNLQANLSLIYPVHSCLTAESMESYTDSVTLRRYDHMKGSSIRRFIH